MDRGLNSKFEKLHAKYNTVFDSHLPGYNGAFGPNEAVVNMGPTLPPQRKGRLPLYKKDDLDTLQSKFDELKSLGVLATPEEAGVHVEYLNPSFLDLLDPYCDPQESNICLPSKDCLLLLKELLL